MQVPSTSTGSSTHSEILRAEFRESESEELERQEGLLQPLLQPKFICIKSGKDSKGKGCLQASHSAERKAAAPVVGHLADPLSL